MPKTKITNKPETVAKVLAQVLYDLNPARTLAQWQEHVDKTGNDPKAFFSGNGAGYEEYLAFTKTFDKDRHDRVRKVSKRSR